MDQTDTDQIIKTLQAGSFAFFFGIFLQILFL